MHEGEATASNLDAEPQTATPEGEDWRASAAAIEARIGEAVKAIESLRALLSDLAPAFRQIAALDEALRSLAMSARTPSAPPRLRAVEAPAPSAPAAAPEPEAPADERDDKARADFRRLVEQTKAEVFGVTAMPRTYHLTFEDRTHSVDLIPLRKALDTIPELTEVTLQRYSEGNATVSVRSDGDLSLARLEDAVREATGRGCQAENIDEFTVLVSLLEERAGA